MMKSAEDRLSSQLAEALDRSMARRVLIQGQMRSDSVVQRDDRTPMGPRSASFFIRGIHGPVA
jgi:hypothetical protein